MSGSGLRSRARGVGHPRSLWLSQEVVRTGVAQSPSAVPKGRHRKHEVVMVTPSCCVRRSLPTGPGRGQARGAADQTKRPGARTTGQRGRHLRVARRFRSVGLSARHRRHGRSWTRAIDRLASESRRSTETGQLGFDGVLVATGGDRLDHLPVHDQRYRDRRVVLDAQVIGLLLAEGRALEEPEPAEGAERKTRLATRIAARPRATAPPARTARGRRASARHVRAHSCNSMSLLRGCRKCVIDQIQRRRPCRQGPIRPR